MQQLVTFEQYQSKKKAMVQKTIPLQAELLGEIMKLHLYHFLICNGPGG